MADAQPGQAAWNCPQWEACQDPAEMAEVRERGWEQRLVGERSTSERHVGLGGAHASGADGEWPRRERRWQKEVGEDLLGRLTGVQLPLEEMTLTKRAYFLQKPERLPQQDVGILFWRPN